MHSRAGKVNADEAARDAPASPGARLVGFPWWSLVATRRSYTLGIGAGRPVYLAAELGESLTRGIRRGPPRSGQWILREAEAAGDAEVEGGSRLPVPGRRAEQCHRPSPSMPEGFDRCNSRCDAILANWMSHSGPASLPEAGTTMLLDAALAQVCPHSQVFQEQGAGRRGEEWPSSRPGRVHQWRGNRAGCD